MAREKKNSPKQRPASPQEKGTPERVPVRVSPTDDPVEAVERVLSRRQLIVEDGDVVIAREGAGLLRGPFGIESRSPSGSTYRLIVRGQHDDSRRVFATYERAIVDAEALAAEDRVRLFYDENGALTLLKDYRPATKG